MREAGMSDSKERIVAELAKLQQNYAAALPAKVAEIRDAWAAAIDGKRLDRLADLRRLAHGMTGSGGAFGYSSVSTAARALEVFVQALLDAHAFPGGDQQDEMDLLLRDLADAVLKPDADAPKLFGVGAEVHPDAPSAGKLVYLVEDDRTLAEQLAYQMGYFGYEVRVLPSPDQLTDALKDACPAALVMDVGFPAGDDAGPKALAALRAARHILPPVLFISGRTDLTARLKAVRAGGIAYFPKPVEIGALVDTLDGLVAAPEGEPGRILIVDDSASLVTLYTHVLRQTGMTVQAVTDPMTILDVLNDFSPELILMDMYMPGCTGEELARVIRQQEAYVGVPIVFLSAETDEERQLAAITLGGDEFLTKPIRPHHLVTAVRARVRRYRTLRSFMERDSLTGLFNHTRIKEQLDIELSRAQRQDRPLAFVMVDIDHFKRVNDTYGHGTGDRVIKSLARLLKQRLRKSDYVGRYGGEEFAVILTDTDGENALRIVDQIRRDFLEVAHLSDKVSFAVTLSAGVAAFPQFKAVGGLVSAADQALYQAKHQGRNQVALAAP